MNYLLKTFLIKKEKINFPKKIFKENKIKKFNLSKFGKKKLK
jgi:hypothetical protein